MTKIVGRDLVAIPMAYIDEFTRDPIDALIKYGSLPQRAHSPWFTDVAKVQAAMTLPDVVCGPASVPYADPALDFRSLVAGTGDFALIEGLSPHFQSRDSSFWHVHVDLALNKHGRGDAAGIAMGREAGAFVDRGTDGQGNSYERIVRKWEIPLVAQVVAPDAGQIYLAAFTKLILQLKQLRGFNITSFSFDGFQSASSMQELALAGLVTAGMRVEDDGTVTGIPTKFSVDGRAVMPYTEVLEAINERRIEIPRYALLRKEMREVEHTGPGLAPDHPKGGSKDVLDPVAGVCGYLAAFGHAALSSPTDGVVYEPEDLGITMGSDYFGVEDEMDWGLDPMAGSGLNFGVEG